MRDQIHPVVVGLASLAILWGVDPAAAQSSADRRSSLPSQQISPVQALFMPRLMMGASMDRFVESLRADFFNADADADGQITQRDVDLHELMDGIQARTQSLNTVMRYDLDGDGFVTEQETRRGMTYDLRVQIGLAAYGKLNGQIPRQDFAKSQIDTMVQRILALDTDKDGKVSVAEASKYNATGRGQNGAASRAQQFLALDAASKGSLSLAEYQAAGEALFREVDSNNDGTISQQELTDYQTRLARAGCEMPKASDKAKVIVLSSYETESLSSAALGSQDNVTHAGRIVVEPGAEPLYVVVVSYSPTIWQISGAVERVERLVLASSGADGPGVARPLVGATGVAQDRVTFFSKRTCLSYFTETPTSASLQTVGAVRGASGKEPVTVAAKYSIGSFRVPSGTIESAREKKDSAPLIIEKTQGTLKIVGDASNVILHAGASRAKDDLARYSPGGVVDIDPKTVVGSYPAIAYQVLPQEAGLVQLLSSGAMSQNSLGEYIVRQKIRFPAGLAGAHGVTFLLMKGVPYPDGDPGHSCVVTEESGEKKGAACR